VVRLVQLGLVAEAARDPFLHACRFCGRCLVNCPHGVQVARLLHRLALARFCEGDPPA
jgi:heterodisulfide reductase subunit C